MTLKERIDTAREEHKRATDKIKEVQANLTDAKGYRERQLKGAEADVKRLKKKSEDSHKEWQKYEQRAETLTIEIETLQKTIETAKADLVKVKEKIQQLETEVWYIYLLCLFHDHWCMPCLCVFAGRGYEHERCHICRGNKQTESGHKGTERPHQQPAQGNKAKV